MAFDKRAYMKEYNKRYKTMRRRFNKKRLLLHELRETTPCEDCENIFPYYVMDFDHTRDEKKAKMSELIYSSWNRFFEELAKCDIVCANCHKKRTHERRLRDES